MTMRLQGKVLKKKKGGGGGGGGFPAPGEGSLDVLMVHPIIARCVAKISTWDECYLFLTYPSVLLFHLHSTFSLDCSALLMGLSDSPGFGFPVLLWIIESSWFPSQQLPERSR